LASVFILATFLEPVTVLASYCIMKGQELLKITFTKLYEEIDDVVYDCEHILRHLFESGLITEKRYRKIEKKQETFERNRYCLVINSIIRIYV